MKSKYLRKIKRRIVLSTLTILCICSQLGNTTVLAMSNEDIMSLINESGYEVSIIIDEDVVASDNQTIFSVNTTPTTGKKGTYSSDGRYSYGGYTGKAWVTTKYLSEQNPQLKADLEDKLGADNLIFKDRTYSYSTSLWDVLIRKNNPVNKAINSKSMRLELGTIGVNNNLQKKNSYAASHLVPLFTYYGIINTDDGLLDFSHSTDDYLSREQGATLLGRFMHPRAFLDLAEQEKSRSQGLIDTMGEDSEYLNYVIGYQGDMLLSSGEHGLTDKDLEAPMKRLEFIYMIMSYFPADVQAAAISKKDCTDILSDIDAKDIVTEKWAKSKGLLDSDGFSKNNNKTFREMIKAKKIGMYDEPDKVEAAYNLGILKKDSKGRANLFKPITKSQAIRMLADMANAVAKGKTITWN